MSTWTLLEVAGLQNASAVLDLKVETVMENPWVQSWVVQSMLVLL